MTSSGEASSSASWTIAASRTPPRSTAVQARPEPGSGQRAPGGRRRRRRSRARAASRRCSASGRRAARPAARAPGRPRRRASAAAGARARAAPRRRPRARRSRRSWPAARAGTARSRPPGPSAHGPTSRPSLAREPAHAEARQRDRQQHRQPARAAARQRDRQLEQQHRRHAPERPRCRAPRARRGRAARARDRRQVRLQQPVGLAALALGEPPRQPRGAGAGSAGRPTAARAATPSTSPPPIDHQVGQALAEPDEQVQQRAAGGAQVRRRGRARRSRRGLDGDVAARAQRLDLERRVRRRR